MLRIAPLRRVKRLSSQLQSAGLNLSAVGGNRRARPVLLDRERWARYSESLVLLLIVPSRRRGAQGVSASTSSHPVVEFWFEFASQYSYLSVMRIDHAAKVAGVRIAWRPFLLGPIFRSFGWSTSPFVLQKEKGAYMWRDLERQCRKYGLPWRRPSEFPRRSVLPARIALLGVDQPWLSPFAQEIMLANFAHDQDIGSESVVRSVLERLALPAGRLLDEAQSDANKARLRTATEVAQRRGIFGAPTFFVGDEMFWGNDRLEDALDCAGSKAAAEITANANIMPSS